MLTPQIVALAILIVGAAALVHGYGGFGFGMTCMTLFALLPCDLERLSVVATIAAGAIIGTLLACSWRESKIDWGRRWSGESIARHKRILAALRDGDGERAGCLVAETIIRARDELIQGLKDARWNESNGAAG